MSTLINSRSMGISLIVIGTLLLITSLSYLAYRAITIGQLEKFEQSWSETATPAIQLINSTPFTKQDDSIPITFDYGLYPANILLPIDWNNSYWGENLTLNPYSNIVEGYHTVNWDSLPSGHTLPTATKIKIPSIQVDASIKELELIDLGMTRAYETPDRIVGHIPETANPGGIGNGWYFAHLESALNREGAIFKNLPLIPEKIRREEPVFIIIESNTTSYLYQVTQTAIKHKEELRVTESLSPVITLVTCVPRLVYDHRLLISAKLIGSKETTR